MHQEEMCVPDVYHQSFPPGAIKCIICYEAELDPFLTVVGKLDLVLLPLIYAIHDSLEEVHDHDDAYEHRRERLHRNAQSRVGLPT
jgi:hypothetical protein